MANLFHLTKDARGNWRRQNLGVRPTDDGDLKKATFTFDNKFDEACKRVVVLEQMWDAIEKDWQADKPTASPMWTPENYAIALAVARGESPIYLEPPADEVDGYSDPETVIAVWIGSLRELFPFLDLRLRDQEDSQAAEQAAGDLAEQMEKQADTLRGTARRIRGHAEGEPLHQAFDAYSKHVLNVHGHSGHGRTQTNQVELLKRLITNQPLNMLTADKLDAILSMICRRPPSPTTNKPLAYFTCRNLLITFRQFIRWLHRSEAFRWEMPNKYNFPRCTIKDIPEDQVQKRKSFKLSELKLIWRYAMAWDRALIVLALNAGFARAELATLHRDEIIERKNRKYISRHRFKTGVYGKWVLWPETVEALEFLAGINKGSDFVVVSKTGKSLKKDTPKGNQNQNVKNHWDRLMKRIIADYPEFHRLPFKHLRKTGASILRNHCGTKDNIELAKMYLAHGERSDKRDPLMGSYTDRHWRKLHKALLRMRRLLLPMFATVPEPWKEKHHRLSPKKTDRILELRAAGKTQKEIADDVGVHLVTVGRICRS